MPPKARRSGARRLARGTRFLRTPGIETHKESHPGRVARNPRHPFRVRIPELSKIFQGYAKNAYPWLISLHRSAVRGRSITAHYVSVRFARLASLAPCRHNAAQIVFRFPLGLDVD